MTVRIVECYDLCVGYQLGLVVGIYSCHIPTNSHHLLTAHTTHHLYLCLTEEGRATLHSCRRSLRDPVSILSGTSPTTVAVEMKMRVM